MRAREPPIAWLLLPPQRLNGQVPGTWSQPGCLPVTRSAVLLQALAPLDCQRGSWHPLWLCLGPARHGPEEQEGPRAAVSMSNELWMSCATSAQNTAK